MAELSKHLLNIFHTTWNLQLISKHKILKLTRNITTEPPTTYVTQQTIDEANSEDSGPSMPDPASCCGEGCQNCVWLEYVYKVKFHYHHNNEHIKAALSQIPCGDTRAFVEFELKKKIQKENEAL